MNENEFYKSILNAALHYLDLGYSVIPIGPDKKPLLIWKKYQKQKASTEEVRSWFEKWPTANIGIITGVVSGIVVVDVEAGGKTENLPPTIIAKTGGGGYHFYYRHPGMPVKNGVRVRELTDIRGDGGYVVAPPSLHSSGDNYVWSVSPEMAGLSELPLWVSDNAEGPGKPAPARNNWQGFFKDTPEGTRNISATQLAGKLLYHLPVELWEIVGWPMMENWNQQYNNPALTADELRNTWNSIRKAEQGKRIKEVEDIVVDPSQFNPMTSEDLLAVLGATIIKDNENKIVTFLSELSAYTENSQSNISFNAPSSTGKSFIATEIARLFPEEDVIEIGYSSPTAFFHEANEFSKELGGFVANLSRKIIIFLDQPHPQLLERLRPLLSHDKKIIKLKITDKNQQQGLRTKNIILIGFPSVIFCTAGLRMDEQESTRFFLLSPDIDQEKIRGAIYQKIKKESDNDGFKIWLDQIPERQLLKLRIIAIKQADIHEINIANSDKITERFLAGNKYLKPRHQRDIGRLLALIKSFALLNLWWRNLDGSTITANEQDVEEAFKIWDKISESQDLNLPPYVYQIYKEIILPLWDERLKLVNGFTNPNGLTRQDILDRHYELYKRTLNEAMLRQQILPMLVTVGLLHQDSHPDDRRKVLIYPTPLNAERANSTNSENEGGVNTAPNSNSEWQGGGTQELDF